MALLSETSYRSSWVSTLASKLSKLHQILEMQSVQLMSDVENDQDQCIFLEKTLDRLTANTAVFKHCRNQQSSREARRRSEATATSCDNSIGATSRYPSPSGLRSKQSRKPSNEHKLDEQNIYSNPMSSRLLVKMSTSQLSSNALPRQISPIRPTTSIFSRRSTAWAGSPHNQPKTIEIDLKKPSMRDSFNPELTLGDELLVENQEKLPTSPQTSPNKPGIAERGLRQDTGSLKKLLKAQVSEALLLSRKQSFARPDLRLSESELKGFRQPLREAGSVAEELNTTLKKLKLKSRGLLDKLSENKQRAVYAGDSLFGRKGSAANSSGHAEVKVLSLAVPMLREKQTPLGSVGERLQILGSP